MGMELKLCSLRSSSKGNATIIFDHETKILVDCGVSGKVIENCLKEIGIEASEIDAIVITHEHSDHIKGVGVVSRKYNLPIFATAGTWRAMKGQLGNIDEGNIRIFNVGESFMIKDIEVTPFKIPHDAAQPVGFTFEKDGTKVAVATDIGVMTKEIFDMIKGSRTVLLESNYDQLMLEAGTYPYELKRRIKGDLGHLCNEDAALTARDLIKTGTREIVLGHISQENNYPDLVFETTKLCLECNGFKVDRDVNLHVMKKDCIGKVC